MKNQSQAVKLLMLAISVVCIGIGLLAFVSEYSPEKSTRFGLVGPFFGKDAKLIGVITTLIGLFPLLFLCKTPKQVAIFGSVLFLAVITTIFGGIFLMR